MTNPGTCNEYDSLSPTEQSIDMGTDRGDSQRLPNFETPYPALDENNLFGGKHYGSTFPRYEPFEEDELRFGQHENSIDLSLKLSTEESSKSLRRFAVRGSKRAAVSWASTIECQLAHDNMQVLGGSGDTGSGDNELSLHMLHMT